MTRKEHLKFCSICTKRKMNMQVGLVCSLTSEIADFETECPHFELDEEEKERVYLMKMAAAGDGDSGDPVDFERNKSLGGVIFIAGLFVTLFSLVVADQTGFFVISFGAIIGGLVLHFKGREQEKIFKENEESKTDSEE